MGDDECRDLYRSLDRARKAPSRARDVLSFTACD
jgi:hypothetical protein